MRICHISSSYNRGGAARAMQRLHVGLKMQHVNSVVFSPDDSEDIKFVPEKKFSQKVRRWAYKKHIEREWQQHVEVLQSYDLFTHDRTPYRSDLIEQLPEADVYHLHWISRFLDIATFFKHVKKPVVWTLHDMNPFTGGCHYDEGCGKYAAGCGACPQLGSSNEDDLSRKIFERKRDVIADIPADRMRIVADSYWLAEEARKSRIFEGKKVDTIHYGLDHNLFKPLDKTSVRNLLGIPEQKKVILFGAPSVSNRRKGYRELMQSIEQLRTEQDDLFLLSFGGGGMPKTENEDHLHLGNIADDRLLVWIYNAADLFVIPSLQEAFGQTCLEAMACGVPCAGFDTGGIPDMIKDGDTGYLAETGKAADLAASIQKVLSEKVMLGRNCRKKVEEKFTLSHQASRYIEIYKQLLVN